MKAIIRVWTVLCVLFFIAVSVSGQQAGDPQTLIGAAEKAKAAGDKASALRNYTEAICALRLSGAPQEKIVEPINERDRLAAALLSELAGVVKQQGEILALQRGIAQKLGRIIITDQDVQARVRKTEKEIKNIETELFDAVK